MVSHESAKVNKCLRIITFNQFLKIIINDFRYKKNCENNDKYLRDESWNLRANEPHLGGFYFGISRNVTWLRRFRYFKPMIGTPAGATTTRASLFGANDATRPEFMVLRVKGLPRFLSEIMRGRNALRINRAFAEASTRL